MLALTHSILTRGAIFLALACLSPDRAYADQQVALLVNGHKIAATVAATFAQREKGLMNRRSMARNEGMLFVFPRVDHHSMWMKNTLIPLDVAFIDPKGRIINIEKMVPLSLEPHSAQKPAKFALEMSAGWFYRHGARVGDSVLGLDAAKK